eukprot:CAMPEP_0119402226 /NCGR_PEP_ID=MMETSP1334-20130426/142770_1 /TAXON_ID=127549 /ORGANISM="Calcidiscus leptoporus, Strain RCC1130" /LENGTH=111 /DNA_ID=CAMNT_0007426153 /DNA_START=657 /DNA_END=992 /DNA_ORIENTATION=-
MAHLAMVEQDPQVEAAAFGLVNPEGVVLVHHRELPKLCGTEAVEVVEDHELAPKAARDVLLDAFEDFGRALGAWRTCCNVREELVVVLGVALVLEPMVEEDGGQVAHICVR